MHFNEEIARDASHISSHLDVFYMLYILYLFYICTSAINYKEKDASHVNSQYVSLICDG